MKKTLLPLLPLLLLLGAPAGVFADGFSGGGGSTILGPITSPPPTFSQSAAVTVTNTVSATSLIGAGFGSATIPANAFAKAGSILRIRGQGFYNQNADVTGFVMQGSLGGTNLWTPVTLSPTLSTGNMIFNFDIVFTAVTVGTSGTISGQGFAWFQTTGTNPNRMQWLNASPITINTTIGLAFDLKVTPGAIAQSFTLTNLVISGY